MAYQEAAIAMTLYVYTSRVICQLQSFSIGMFYSCKISTEKHVASSLCNSRASCHDYEVCTVHGQWNLFEFLSFTWIKKQTCCYIRKSIILKCSLGIMNVTVYCIFASTYYTGFP